MLFRSYACLNASIQADRGNDHAVPVVLVIASAFLTSGCSVFIASCGKDLSTLKDGDQVRQEFGKPEACGVQNGTAFEDFKSACKVSDGNRATGLLMLAGMTLGLSELIMFPNEVYREWRSTVVGQDIRFYYDQEGKLAVL